MCGVSHIFSIGWRVLKSCSAGHAGIKGGEGNRVPQVDRQVIRPLFLLCKDPHKRDLANMLSGPGACGSGAGLLC